MEDQQEKEAPCSQVLCACRRHSHMDLEAYGTLAELLRGSSCGTIRTHGFDDVCPSSYFIEAPFGLTHSCRTSIR